MTRKQKHGLSKNEQEMNEAASGALDVENQRLIIEAGDDASVGGDEPSKSEEKNSENTQETAELSEAVRTLQKVGEKENTTSSGEDGESSEQTEDASRADKADKADKAQEALAKRRAKVEAFLKKYEINLGFGDIIEGSHIGKKGRYRVYDVQERNAQGIPKLVFVALGDDDQPLKEKLHKRGERRRSNLTVSFGVEALRGWFDARGNSPFQEEQEESEEENEQKVQKAQKKQEGTEGELVDDEQDKRDTEVALAAMEKSAGKAESIADTSQDEHAEALRRNVRERKVELENLRRQLSEKRDKERGRVMKSLATIFSGLKHISLGNFDKEIEDLEKAERRAQDAARRVESELRAIETGGSREAVGKAGALESREDAREIEGVHTFDDLQRYIEEHQDESGMFEMWDTVCSVRRKFPSRVKFALETAQKTFAEVLEEQTQYVHHTEVRGMLKRLLTEEFDREHKENIVSRWSEKGKTKKQITEDGALKDVTYEVDQMTGENVESRANQLNENIRISKGKGQLSTAPLQRKDDTRSARDSKMGDASINTQVSDAEMGDTTESVIASEALPLLDRQEKQNKTSEVIRQEVRSGLAHLEKALSKISPVKVLDAATLLYKDFVSQGKEMDVSSALSRWKEFATVAGEYAKGTVMHSLRDIFGKEGRLARLRGTDAQLAEKLQKRIVEKVSANKGVYEQLRARLLAEKLGITKQRVNYTVKNGVIVRVDDKSTEKFLNTEDQKKVKMDGEEQRKYTHIP